MEKKSKKKPAAKPSAKRSAGTIQPGSSGGSNAPFFVLVIIILITVIVLLLNKFYDNGKFSLPSLKNINEKADTVKEKSEAVKDKIPADKSSVKEKISETEDKSINKDVKKTEPELTTVDKEVNIFFLKLDEKSEKIYLSTVKRKVPVKQILTVTLDQLVKGPTAYEKGKGYISAVPSHLKVRGIEMKGKTAEIDFNGVIEEGAAGDILLKRIQQIVHTATQFDDVESVVIKINGQRRKTIGGDGFSISGPLRR